ncbi:hypothetical protein [Curtobacterium sp. MCBD17_040]|uniref:hypothetical protein n=1 Tax=Curtobacterium sp. MCBD17_040 TaxID=2175674 RepID=UPI000DA9DC11|nr:hypothetical protein [Curtobacterium sp. MCBD17_040]WIB65308.1 hypothetical protein DEI94_18045 [Curtobacterium sp. MCBD17_040]
MNAQLREKHTGVPTDNGGRYAGHERAADDITLTAAPEAESDPTWDTEPYVPVHTLSPHLVPLALAAIDKANKRLARYGIDGRFEGTLEDGTEHLDDRTIPVTYLTLSRPHLELSGWTFTGTHDVTDDGQMLHYPATTDLPVPEVTDTTCEFCGKSRRRERVYTLHHSTDGSKQVGKSCLEAFLGVKPKGLWALEWTLDEKDLDDADDAVRWSSAGSDVFDAEELLAAAASTTGNGESFVAKSRASMEHPATSDALIMQWDAAHDAITDDGRQFARDTLTWLRTTDEIGDYIGNLKASLIPKDGTQKWVARKHVGIAVSAISAYRRHLDREAEMAAKEKARQEYQPGFVAPVGEKIAPAPATIVGVFHPEPRSLGYGRMAYTTIVKMIDASGHQVTWFASGTKMFEVGSKVNYAGTVKDHSEYQGVDQTIITRAKITDPDTGDKLGD